MTSFPRAVQAEEDEVVILSWAMWPDKAARDAGNEKSWRTRGCRT